MLVRIRPRLRAPLQLDFRKKTNILLIFDLGTVLGTENGPGRARERLISFLEAVRLSLAEYVPVGSHRDPAHEHFYRVGTHMLCPNCPISPEQQNNLLHTFPPQSIVSRAGETT